MTEPKIFPAMANAMAEVTAIAKNKSNPQQGFKYRGIDDVYNAVNPVLAKNGIFMTSSIVSKERHERVNQKGTVLAFTALRMRYSFWAPDGSHVETEVEGEGMDSGDKSSNKAMAIAHKYALLQAFCIPTEALDDPDSEVHEATAKARHDEAPQPVVEYEPTPDEIAQSANAIRRAIDHCNDLESLNALYAERKGALAQIRGADADAFKAAISYFSARKAEIVAASQAAE